MALEPLSADPDRDPVDVLADEFAERYRRGETPSITEYVRRYPEHAEQIEMLFPSVALLEQLGSRPEGADTDSRPVSLGSLPPHHHVGDFEIVREIGRGGMGVVYEAVQQSLHRPVALKVLSVSSLHSANQARRFEREAQAAAQLHHTNIVPVFGVGEQDGLRYYVMQQIHGLGLDAVLAELVRRAGLKSSAANWSVNQADQSVSAQTLAGVLISGELSPSKSGTANLGQDSLTGSAASAVTTSGSTKLTPAPTAAGERVGAYIQDSSSHGGDASGDVTAPYYRSDLMGCGGAATRQSVRSSLILRDEITADQDFEIATAPSRQSKLDDDRGGVRSSHAFGRRYWRNIARIGMQVASGLQYAHSQGTLHRDIKPANILLDTDGTAWIADFGLAKVLEADNVTRTGDVVGTLRYMAPEQFHGEAHARSDIYSLGLTLYELLTLRPAYDETDRQKLIARKLTPHDPPSVRKWVRDVPRDLETIVQKCLAYEAGDRYASAGALLADLQAFVEDRPIRARQSSSAERVWRWCRRNPAVAGLSGTVALLLLVTLGLTSAGYLKEKQRAEEEGFLRAEAVSERVRADAARKQYEEIAAIAFQAFDEIGQSFVSNDVIGTIELDDDNSEQQFQVPAYSPETAAIMEQLRSSFDELAKVAGTDRRFLDYAARADLRAGELHLRLNQPEQARDAFSRAIGLYENADTERQDPEIRLQLARLYNGKGAASGYLRDWDAKRDAQEKALLLLGDAGERPEMQFELARTHYLMGHRIFGPGPGDGPPPGNERRERPPDSSGFPGPPPRPQDGLGPPAGDGPPQRPDGEWSRRASEWRVERERRSRDWESRSQENRAHLGQAAALFADLVENHPSVSVYQYWLALCYLETAKQSLGSAEADVGRVQAVEILQALCDQHPEKTDYLYQLSEAYQLSYAQLSQRPGWGLPRVPDQATHEQIESVEGDLLEALHVSDELIKRQPHVPGYAVSHLKLLLRLVDVKQAQKDYRSAIEYFDRAQAARIALADRFPDTQWFSGPLGAGLDLMREILRAHALVGESKFAEARTILQPVVDRFEQHDRGGPDSRGRPRRLPREVIPVYQLLETCLKHLDEPDQAAAIRAKIAEMTRDEESRGRGFGPPRRPETAGGPQ